MKSLLGFGLGKGGGGSDVFTDCAAVAADWWTMGTTCRHCLCLSLSHKQQHLLMVLLALNNGRSLSPAVLPHCMRRMCLMLSWTLHPSVRSYWSALRDTQGEQRGWQQQRHHCWSCCGMMEAYWLTRWEGKRDSQKGSVPCAQLHYPVTLFQAVHK